MKGSVRLCWNPTVPEVAWQPLIPRLVPVMAGGFRDIPPFQWDKPPITQDFFFTISIWNYQPVMVWAVAVTYYRASEGLHRMKPRLFMFRKAIFEPVSNAGSEQEFQRDCTKTKHVNMINSCSVRVTCVTCPLGWWLDVDILLTHDILGHPQVGELSIQTQGVDLAIAGQVSETWKWKTRKKSLVGG